MTRLPPSSTFVVLTLCLALIACGGRSPIKLPDRVGGQLPTDYRMEETRGVILARVTVITAGEPGFGPITNPLFVEFRPGIGDDPSSPSVTLMSLDAHVLGAATQRPTVWKYEPPGLLAVSMAPGSYNGMGIAYPDFSTQSATPSSIPVPSAGLVFAPIEIRAGEIVYVGDIEIRQNYGAWEYFAGRADVTYAVHDDYERTVADFRARYPRLAAVAVAKRVAKPAGS